MKNQTNYFITGGTGFIGSALIKKLDGNIKILSRKSNLNAYKDKSISIIQKDILDLKKDDLKNVDIIYHLASTVDNYNVLTNPYLDVNTNINGILRLLEICKELNKKPKIIFPSTFFVYGNQYDKSKIAINEDSKTDPLALYPITKLATEEIIKFYSKLYNIPYIICRLTNVYGESENGNNSKKAGLNFILKQIVNGEEIKLYQAGEFFRDYIYVDDVISAFLFLENKVSNDSFLIGYGQPIEFKKLIKYAFDFSKSKSKIISVEPPKFHEIVGINNFSANISKIKALGWSPKIGYQEGIRRIIKSYQI